MRGIPFLFVFFLLSCSQNPAPVTYYGTTPGAGSAGAHTVVVGDTLWSISGRYNIAMQDIVLSNNLRAPFLLAEGQRLKLPPPPEYKVRSGDTLYAVSRIFGVTTSELVRLNDLREPYVIVPGQVIRLPSKSQMQKQQPAPREVTVRSASASRAAPRTATKAQPKARVQQASLSRAARAIKAKTPPRSSGKFLKPVSGKIISTYGPKANSLHNDGINIAAPLGTPVKAAENGVVVYAGNELKGSGNLVLVRHADRWMTAYAHLDRISVARGATIKAGQKLGTVGSTGSVDRPQLHFEIRRGVNAVNPVPYLN